MLKFSTNASTTLVIDMFHVDCTLVKSEAEGREFLSYNRTPPVQWYECRCTLVHLLGYFTMHYYANNIF